MAWRLLRNLARLVVDLVTAPLASRVPRDWIVLRLDRGLIDVPLRPSLPALVPTPRSLSEILDCLERARDDRRVKGALLRVGKGALGWATVQTLSQAIASFRAADKRVVVHADDTGNAGAWLGAVADHFWMTPEGSLDLIGVSIDSPYLRRALDRLKIHPQVISAGRYKSFGEVILRDSMSDDAREALESVIDQLYDSLTTALVEGRDIPLDGIRSRIDEGPYLAEQALEAGLVDELVYADEFPARLAELSRDPAQDGSPAAESEEKLLADRTYLRVSRPRLRWTPVLRGPDLVAVVSLQGMIGRRAGSTRGVVGVLRRLQDDPEVLAVVLRVNSPGGDALASDLIWRAVNRLAAVKPVVSSMGDVAASGGYYVAMAANEILAEPATLTGSIGVVLAGLELEELLDELGVSLDGVSRGAHARIYSGLRRRSDSEVEVLKGQVERRYRSFLRKVAQSRGLEEEELAERAEGRVWTGAQALEGRLIDALGGLDAAIDRARALAGLEPGQGEVVHVDLQRGLLGRVLRPDPLEDAPAIRSGVQLLCPILLRLQ